MPFVDPSRPRSLAAILVGLVVSASVAGAIVLSVHPFGRIALAQRGTPIATRVVPPPSPTPSGPLFCGVANRGGTVRMQFSEDGNRILWFELQERGIQFNTRESCVSGGAPVMERRFIMDCERESSFACPTPTQRRCERAPCDGGSPTPRPTVGPRPTATPSGPGGPGRCRVAPCFGPLAPQAPVAPQAVCDRRLLQSVQVIGGLDQDDLDKATVTGTYQVFFLDGTTRRFVMDSFTAWNQVAAPCP